MYRDSRKEILETASFVETNEGSEEIVAAAAAPQGECAVAGLEVHRQEEEAMGEERTEAETEAGMGGWSSVEELADSLNALDTTAKTECPANALEAHSMHPKKKPKHISC